MYFLHKSGFDLSPMLFLSCDKSGIPARATIVALVMSTAESESNRSCASCCHVSRPVVAIKTEGVLRGCNGNKDTLSSQFVLSLILSGTSLGGIQDAFRTLTEEHPRPMQI